MIVVDEVHHAAAKSYTAVLDYFKPKFLLGITATPQRMDGQDIYALCDGNVAYQLHFVEAISRGWLSPFHYYGIYDETDYNQITWLGARYDEKELLHAQLQEDRAAIILRGWERYRQTRTLGFCSSISQANFLSNYFKGQGFRALSLHSRTTEMTRAEAIAALTEGELEIIFTVDLFNEGVDIPSVDTLLFVRPTESLTVFTQQVGRGLRLAEGKSHCVIIDLIGNYRNAEQKLSLIRQDFGSPTNERQSVAETASLQLPAECVIDLEIGIINWLESLLVRKHPRKEKLLSAYGELKRELGRRPSYLELHLHGLAPSNEYQKEFKSYPGFLLWAGELSDEESQAYMQAESWLKEIESTRMTKSYKMVLLFTMLERGGKHWSDPITSLEAAPLFYSYIMGKEYRRKIDFSGKETGGLAAEYNENKMAALIEKMPMKKWSGSSKELVTYANGTIILNREAVTDSSIVYEWTREICLYRLQTYFERKA